jgi:hypothetical protein
MIAKVKYEGDKRLDFQESQIKWSITLVSIIYSLILEQEGELRAILVIPACATL